MGRGNKAYFCMTPFPYEMGEGSGMGVIFLLSCCGIYATRTDGLFGRGGLGVSRISALLLQVIRLV